LLTHQDVIPYVVSDFLSWLLPSILSPLCYILLVYFIADLRSDNLAANLLTVVASVRSHPHLRSKLIVRPSWFSLQPRDWLCCRQVCFSINKCQADSIGRSDTIIRSCFIGRKRPQSIHAPQFWFLAVSLHSLQCQWDLMSSVDVPPYVSWIRWISPYFYSYRMFFSLSKRNCLTIRYCSNHPVPRTYLRLSS
jgi:hypothetical protein